MASLEPLASRIASLEEKRKTALTLIRQAEGQNGAKIDLVAPIPNTNRSITEIDLRVSLVVELCADFATSGDVLALPEGLVNPTLKPAAQMEAQYTAILDQFSAIDNNGGMGNLDVGSFTAQSQNGQAALNLAPAFQNIWNHSEAFLQSYYPLAHALGKKAGSDFSSVVQKLRDGLHEIAEERNRLAGLANAAAQKEREISEFLTKSGAHQTEIDRLKGEAEKDRKTLAEYASEGTQSVTTVRSTLQDAEKVKANVDAYQSNFETFQNKLNEREETIQKGTERQSTLIKSLEDLSQRIDDTNQRAEAMLSGATVTGLASSYGKLRDDLVKELKWARWAFYFAIFVLFGAVVPLAAYVIPGLGEALGFALTGAKSSLDAKSGTELVGQILARALLLLPAAWFAKFAAGRHAALFRLKEHYAFKYSVASSVDGFKKQAEPFKDAIAAATFFELTFNPAERMDAKGQGDRHPNMVMEWVMKKLGTTYDGKVQ